MPFYASENGCTKKNIVTNIGENVEKQKLSTITTGNIKCYREFLKKSNINLPYELTIHSYLSIHKK